MAVGNRISKGVFRPVAGKAKKNKKFGYTIAPSTFKILQTLFTKHETIIKSEQVEKIKDLILRLVSDYEKHGDNPLLSRAGAELKGAFVAYAKAIIAKYPSLDRKEHLISHFEVLPIDDKKKIELADDVLKIVKKLSKPPKIPRRKEAKTKKRRVQKATVNVFIGVPGTITSYDQVYDLENVVIAFLSELDIELESKDEPKISSFFRWLQFTFKRHGEKELGDLYNVGKEALKAAVINKPSAENSEKLAKAAAAVLDKIGPFKHVAIRVEALLILKTVVGNEDVLVVETISPELSNLLDQNPALLKNPQNLLEILNKSVAAIDSQSNQ